MSSLVEDPPSLKWGFPKRYNLHKHTYTHTHTHTHSHSQKGKKLAYLELQYGADEGTGTDTANFVDCPQGTGENLLRVGKR